MNIAAEIKRRTTLACCRRLTFSARRRLFSTKNCSQSSTSRWWKNLALGARLGADRRVRADARTQISPIGEVRGKLGVPRPGSLGHRPLRRHPFFDRTPAVIEFVRFHWSPLRLETNGPSTSLANGWLISTARWISRPDHQLHNASVPAWNRLLPCRDSPAVKADQP